MNVEDTLRETFETQLGGVEPTSGDVAEARRDGERRRTRRRLTVGMALLAVVVVSVGVALGDHRVATGTNPATTTTGQWRELPTPPLSPRADALGVWSGSEVVVFGGEANPCPPNADCGYSASDGLRDGAAYDPETDTWHRIADAPVPVLLGDRLVAVGRKIILRHSLQDTHAAWYAYDPKADAWSTIPVPPRNVRDLPAALGATLYAVAGGRVVTYNSRADLWRTLPADPLEPALDQQVVTATPLGPVVTGLDSTQPNDGTTASLVLADVFDGTTWRRLPATGQVGNTEWAWTGDRLVEPEPFTQDGGQANGWGRRYPVGGSLDLATGTWSPLPDAMAEVAPEGWSVNAAGGRWVATYGHIFDTVTGRVGTLPRPEHSPDYAMTAVWAGERLLVFGGAGSAQGFSGAGVTNHAWIYTP